GSPASSSSTSTRPLIPKCTPTRTSGSRVSSTICLPRRRAAVKAFPTSACRNAAAVVPRFMNQVSGACTFTISRSRARASSTLRAASTSRISGTSGKSLRSDVGDRALHRTGHREHLAHSGSTLGAFVADHDDVAGFDAPGEDRGHGEVLAVEDTGAAVESHLIEAGDFHDRTVRCERTTQHGDTALHV